VKGAATRSCERRKGTRRRKIEKKAEEDWYFYHGSNILPLKSWLAIYELAYCHRSVEAIEIERVKASVCHTGAVARLNLWEESASRNWEYYAKHCTNRQYANICWHSTGTQYQDVRTYWPIELLRKTLTFCQTDQHYWKRRSCDWIDWHTSWTDRTTYRNLLHSDTDSIEATTS
jgi:hypothetical protein